MKRALFLVLCTFAFSVPILASPQDIGTADSHTVAPVPEGEALSLEAIESSTADETNALGYWHCTAYAEGHGHSWGFDYRDIHYNHAYYGAMNRCEQATQHHCHDVHCHYDWH